MDLSNTNIISAIIMTVIVIVAIIIGKFAKPLVPEGDNFTVDSMFVMPYELSKPDKIFSLPRRLKEISGLERYDDNYLLAIQDENGIIFKFNIQTGEIDEEIKFGGNRDYEGVAATPDKVFVLEGDGDLFEVGGLGTTNQYTNKHETDLKLRDDTEGASYDSIYQQILIVPKETPTGRKYDDKKVIYGFDPVSRRLLKDPLYTIDMHEVGEIILKEKSKYQFKPSGIAVHPKSQNIYLIASVGKLMIVLNRNGMILHIQVLDRKVFQQPEGITFDHEGNLYISSEGVNGPGKIVRFTPKPDPSQQTENQ